MAVTRSFLKGMGLTDEQVGAIIEEHTNTVNGLKADRDKYKIDAEKLVEAQKKLSEYEKGDDWKAKYETLDKTFKDYKAEMSNKEKSEKIKSAYTGLLKDASIDAKRIDAILRVTDFGDMKLKEDGTLEDADKLSESIKTEWAAFVTKTSTKGAEVETPPKDAAGKAKMTKAEIMAITDRTERRKAIAENPELFGLAPAENAN